MDFKEAIRSSVFEAPKKIISEELLRNYIKTSLKLTLIINYFKDSPFLELNKDNNIKESHEDDLAFSFELYSKLYDKDRILLVEQLMEESQIEVDRVWEKEKLKSQIVNEENTEGKSFNDLLNSIFKMIEDSKDNDGDKEKKDD